MTRIPAYLRDSPVTFEPPPPEYRILQRIGNALYFCPCPDFPDSTPSRTVALQRLGTLKAWHRAQGHGVSGDDEYAFEATSDGRVVAAYACHATAYQVREVK